MATRIVESFFSRRASAGCSSMATTCEAWTIETLAGMEPPRGPDGRLVADEDQSIVRVAPGMVEGARDDLGDTVVAAHRVDRDADAVVPRRAATRAAVRSPRQRAASSGVAAGLSSMASRPLW